MDKDLVVREDTYLEEAPLAEKNGFLDNKLNKAIIVALMIIIACISIFGISQVMADPETYGDTIAALDEKKTTVMELTAATTATSVGIAAIPGDATTPIANKLMDLSSWYVVIIAVIIVEKYLLTLMGVVAAKAIIPIACVMFAWFAITKSDAARVFAIKMLILAVSLVMVLPTSVYVSDLLQATYDDTINTTIETSKEISATMDGSNDAIEDAKDEASSEDNKDKNPLEWLKDQIASAQDKAENAVGSITSGVSGSVDKLKAVLNQFIEMVAILIVVNCVMPILVITFFFWVVKMIFGLDFEAMGKLSSASKKISAGGKKLTSKKMRS